MDDFAQQLPPHLQHYPPLFKQLRHDKLWHQLTVALHRFAEDPAARPHLPVLFKTFISAPPLPALMSPFAFGRLAIMAAAREGSVQEAGDLLAGIRAGYAGRADPEQRAVFLLTSVEYAHCLLLLATPQSAVEARRVLEHECQPIMSELLGLAPTITAAYHRVMAEVCKADSNYDAYYRHSCAYLSLLKEDGVGDQADAVVARDFMMAALLSPRVYNFGELLSFEAVLARSQDPQLVQLIRTFQSGDIAAPLPATSDPLLTANGDLVSHKRKLMALTATLTAHSQHGHRHVPMAALAEHLGCADAAEAERLLLDALALDLFDGRIDQCAMAVELFNVAPLHVNVEQIKTMRDGFARYLSTLDDCIARVRSDLPATVTL